MFIIHGRIVIAGMYSYPPPLPILDFFCFQQEAPLVVVLTWCGDPNLHSQRIWVISAWIVVLSSTNGLDHRVR